MSWEVPELQFFRGLDLNTLQTDEAFLNLTYEGIEPIWLYTLNEECHLCPYEKMDTSTLMNDHESIVTVGTHHATHIRIRNDGNQQFVRFDEDDGNALCDVTASFGEFGVYDLKVENGQCQLSTALDPVDANFALLVCFLVYVGAALLWWGVNRLPGPYGKDARRLGGFFGWIEEKEEKPGKKRLRSLDTFRGISIAIMIFVNYGGGGYWFLDHSTWNGLQVADLVFPWFMWIMGVCIPMSVRSHAKRNTPKATILWQVTVRSVKLFLLGFVSNTLGWVDLERLRVPGVLQRFGLCYFVVAVLGTMFAKAEFKTPGSKLMAKLQDLTSLAPQWVLMAALVAVHTSITQLVAAPGCPKGYVGPGGLHDWSKDNNNTDCIGGIAGYIDKAFLTSAHIYCCPTAAGVYQSGAFDPEGTFGSLLSIFQVFLGYQAGQIIQVYSGHVDRLSRFVTWGVLTGVAGTILCGASKNDGWIPLNKNLWSLSFVFITTSFAFFLLAILYFMIDMKQWWKGQPLVYAGMNSIVLYLGHEVGNQIFPWHFAIGPMKTHAAKLPEALWGATLWVFVSYVLYRKNVFITV